MAGRPATLPDIDTFAGAIGAEIRRRRERKRLSVPDVAAAVGSLPSSWYQWERGLHLPLERLPAIAKALGCSPRDLMPR